MIFVLTFLGWLITNDRSEIKVALLASACIAPYFFKNIFSLHPPPAEEKIFKLTAATRLLNYVFFNLSYARLIEREKMSERTSFLFLVFTLIIDAVSYTTTSFSVFSLFDFLDLISFAKITLNTVLTSGWMKKSCVKKANGKFKHTSFSQSARSFHILNPAW